MKFTYSQQLELQIFSAYFDNRTIQIEPDEKGQLIPQIEIVPQVEPEFEDDTKYDTIQILLCLKVSDKPHRSSTYEVNTELPEFWCTWMLELKQGKPLTDREARNLITLINRINIIA